MIGLKRMANIQDCIETIIQDDVPGDLIETGVWRGGATIFMRANLNAYGDTTRKVWVADSFEGLPAPDASGTRRTPATAPQADGSRGRRSSQVKHNFRRYGCSTTRSSSSSAGSRTRCRWRRSSSSR